MHVAEDWQDVYRAISDIDFTAYDQNTLRQAIVDYLKETYPETFNDWIASSEFVMLLDTLTWLSQNVNYRIDLNSRENLLQTSERRESILRLAANLAYNVSRVQAGKGALKVTSLRTSQTLLDLDGRVISGGVVWNDSSDPNWYDKWVIIMNAAFDARTKFGSPLRKWSNGTLNRQSYRLNSPAPVSGIYPFTVQTQTGSLDCDVVNSLLNEDTGELIEQTPERLQSFHLYYQSDGQGSNSINTGFMLPWKQGRLRSTTFNITNPQPNLSYDISVSNINDKDVWLTEIDSNGFNKDVWTRTDTLSNESLSYNPASSSRKSFEVYTLPDDKIRLRFGDGKFSAIPKGNFKVSYRQSDPLATQIKIFNLRNIAVTIPYVSNGTTYQLTMTLQGTADGVGQAVSETATDIKTRASRVFYTQNRMVTSEDYNSLPLKNPGIEKLKVTNRSFAGQSLSEVTSASLSRGRIESVASDGRIFIEKHETQRSAIFDQTLESPESFIDEHVAPLIATEDKQIIYYQNYPKFNVPDLTFISTSSIQGRSKGKFNSQPDASTLQRLVPGSILEFQNGLSVRLDQIVPSVSVTSDDSIKLRDKVNFTSNKLIRIMPGMRRKMSVSEKRELTNRLIQRKQFGIRWSQEDKWEFIEGDDLKPNGDFDLTNAGDRTSNQLDGSWLIKFSYSITDTGTDNWLITDRGMWLNFESTSDISFLFADSENSIDPNTLRPIIDEIEILKSNESINSLKRLGLTNEFYNTNITGKQTIIGDGTTNTFRLRANKINASNVFLEKNGELDITTEFAIKEVSDAAFVEFTNAPVSGSVQTLIIDPAKSKIKNTSQSLTASDAQTAFNTIVTNTASENIFVFKQGLMLSPLSDYDIVNIDGFVRLILSTGASDQDAIAINAFENVKPLFVVQEFMGDSSNRFFDLRMPTDYAMVFVDGVRQSSDFTINTSAVDSHRIDFDVAPMTGAKIVIYVKKMSDFFTIEDQSFVAQANDTDFSISTNTRKDMVMIWSNGSYRTDVSHDTSSNTAQISDPASENDNILVTYITSDIGQSTASQADFVNDGTISEASYLQDTLRFKVVDHMYHPDGYINRSGVRISNIDDDLNGFHDKPYNFSEFVLPYPDDVILKMNITVDGYEKLVPIDETTTPRGTYTSARHRYTEGQSYNGVQDGIEQEDIHFDVATKKWLIAQNGTWNLHDAQDDFKWYSGRGNLDFKWTHVSDDGSRLDMEQGNIHDVFVLTSTYHAAIRQWIVSGGTEPTPPSSDTLRTAYSDLEELKMLSDTLVWRPARFKYLFGSQAIPELQGRFLVVKNPASNLTDNDVKQRVLEAVDEYFNIDRWSFGSSFYFSDLSAYIHRQLASNILSVVITSTTGFSFGQMAQARCEPHELFISNARIEDIQVVQNLSNSVLNRA